MWIAVSLLLFSLSLWASADKLNQGFLPPTGAATAGGYPGDISAPLPGDPNASTVIPIISYYNQPNTGDGSYSYAYETGNGIKANEEGAVKQLSPEGEAQVVQGAYSYTGPDGVLYTITYKADENGYVALGDHIPTAPPIPPEIQAALEQNAVAEAAAQTQPGTSAPAQIAYFKNYPFAIYNRNHYYNPNQYYYNKYFKRY